jgi:arylsulfatase A-like enzyme
MKNIILIITDTFRYDNLAENAGRPVRTPELERFAAERAVSIERCYTGSFPTIPHRTDLASGRLGWPHYGWQPIELSGPNHIAAMLGEAGYATQLICDCPHLFNAHFNAAFDAAYQHRGQEGDKGLLHLNDPIERVLPLEKTRAKPIFRGHTLADMHRWINRYRNSEWDTFPAKTAETTIRWLEENNRAGPFFLWVDFFDPHEPWDPPEYMVKRYDPHYSGTPMIHPNYGPASDYTSEEMKNLRAHYAAESELVDRWIGRIIQKVDDLELWDDSIVLITSDHGTSVGEHERTGKSNIHRKDPRFWPIYPEIGHVPCLLAGGEIPTGESLDFMVQPVDFLPTLCDLAEVKVSPVKPFEGSSFAGAVLERGSSHRDFVVSGYYVESRAGRIPKKAAMPFLVSDRWGYAPIGAVGKPELYDIDADPLAENDLSSDHAGELRELHELFIEYLKEHSASEAFLSLWDSGKHGLD